MTKVGKLTAAAFIAAMLGGMFYLGSKSGSADSAKVIGPDGVTVANPCMTVFPGDHIYLTGVDKINQTHFGPYVAGCTGVANRAWSLHNAQNHIVCGDYAAGYRSIPKSGALPFPTQQRAGDIRCVGAVFKDVNGFTFTVPANK
jgi:hypothetical protein